MAGLAALRVSIDRVQTRNKQAKSQDVRGECGKKERGARQPHKRLRYYVNVNRTSLDHLLLGKNADVDKSVE
jgi:hypothetical protein